MKTCGITYLIAATYESRKLQLFAYGSHKMPIPILVTSIPKIYPKNDKHLASILS